jgi:hypothetical protein
MRKVVLQDAGVNLSIASTQDTRCTDVLQRVKSKKILGFHDTINTIPSYGFELSKWYITVAKNVAILVNFADYNEYVKFIMI